MALTDEEFAARMATWSKVNDRLAEMDLGPALWGDMKDFFDWTPQSTAQHIADLRREPGRSKR